MDESRLTRQSLHSGEYASLPRTKSACLACCVYRQLLFQVWIGASLGWSSIRFTGGASHPFHPNRRTSPGVDTLHKGRNSCKACLALKQIRHLCTPFTATCGLVCMFLCSEVSFTPLSIIPRTPICFLLADSIDACAMVIRQA